MGFLDKAKAQLTKAVDEHGDKIVGRHGQGGGGDRQEDRRQARRQDRQGRTKAQEALDKLDGKNDDFGKGGTTSS